MTTETTKKATEAEKKTDAANAETSTAKKPAASSKTAAKDVKSTESKTTVEKKNDTKKSEKSDTSTTSDKKTTERKVEKKTGTTKSEEVKTKVEPEKSDKSVEVSDLSKEDVSTEMQHEEERTMFALELKRKVPMYTHMSMNAACRMIKGNVICKSDKPTNGWITIYAGVPEIGKVTGYIRIEQLGWR